MLMENLPVEILYRILDLMNFKDIQLSFRFVCKKFFIISNSYPRMKIEFNYQISNKQIRQLCYRIQPENIIELNLQNSYFNSNVIKTFFSMIYINKLTQLRSLILYDIDQYDFQTFIQSILIISTLNSVTIRMNIFKVCDNDLVGLLESLISHRNIRHLNLDITDKIINRIKWPNTYTLQKLTLQHCNYEQLCSIFERSPNLQTFVLNKNSLHDINTNIHPVIFQSLTSLTLKDIQISIDDLEFFISLHPSLISLQLIIKSICSMDFFQKFSQWEDFLGKTLPNLKNFQFYICIYILNFEHIQSILSPFCTRFWLEEKHWFITCECTNHLLRNTFAIYSSTYRNTSFPDNINFGKMTYTFTTNSYHTQINTNNMWTARFSLLHMMRAIHNKEVKLPDNDMSNNMSHLAIEVDRECSIDVIEHLSKLINLSSIEELWLIEKQADGLEATAIENLLCKTKNIRILGLSLNDYVKSKILDIASIISHRIDHLKLYITDINSIKLFLKYIKGISTITFEQRDHYSSSLLDIIQWIERKRRRRRRRYFLYNNDNCIQIWMDKCQHDLFTLKRGHKRKYST